MKIREPCCITSRLLAGVRIGDGEVSIDYSANQPNDGRTRYIYWIDTPTAHVSGCDLRSGVQGGRLQYGLATLLSFLSDFGAGLFPQSIAEWACRNAGELSAIAYDLEGCGYGAPNLIEED